MNMINHIQKIVSYQQRLLNSFKESYPQVRDYERLFDVPSHGEIYLEGERWGFRKHGRGVAFTRELPLPALVVDMHRYFNNPLLIDGWRLLLFYDSSGIQNIREDLTPQEKELTDQLTKLAAQGLLEKMTTHHYMLKTALP